MQTTEPSEWRTQAESNRQGSGSPLPHAVGQQLSEDEVAFQRAARDLYEHRLSVGVAREQARKDLPLCIYTEAYWKVDLHNLLHFLALRMDSHAQAEIRDYAKTIGEQIVRPLFPIVWEAFCDYRLEGMSLTRLEIQIIQKLQHILSQRESGAVLGEEDFLAAQDESWKTLNRSRERDECRSKLQRLGILPN